MTVLLLKMPSPGIKFVGPVFLVDVLAKGQESQTIDVFPFEMELQ